MQPNFILPAKMLGLAIELGLFRYFGLLITCPKFLTVVTLS